MADPKNDVVPAYGEGDMEAKSMDKAAEKAPAAPSAAAEAKVPPPDVAMPAAGTTETDLARNIREKAAREAAKP